MSAAHDYEDLHALVDRLKPHQARQLRAVALRLVESDEATESDEPELLLRRRRLSFAGTLNSGVRDLAERHEEILSEGLDRPM